MKWKKPITTDVFDTDLNGVVRASSFLKYLQTAATAQIQDCPPTADDLRAMGRAFILSSIDVDIARPIHAWETLLNESWGCPGRGYTYPRCYQMSDGDGIILRGISSWALVDFREGKLLRYEDCHIGFVPEMPLDIKVPRFKLPSLDQMMRLGTYRVLYGVTDQNRHLNNTYYPDMFTSSLDMEGRWVKHMTIRFLNEAPMGETLTVYGIDDGDGVMRFLSLREDGEINAEALFVFSTLDV